MVAYRNRTWGFLIGSIGLLLVGIFLLGVYLGEQLVLRNKEEQPKPVVQSVKNEQKAAQKIEVREARLAILALSRDKKRLEEEVRTLHAENSDLREALAKERIQADTSLIQRERHEVAFDSIEWNHGDLRNKAYRIVDVEPSLNYVAVDAGREQGVKPGLHFGVKRGRKVIALIEVLEVRSGVTGAVVRELMGDAFPRQGDSVVLWNLASGNGDK